MHNIYWDSLSHPGLELLGPLNQHPYSTHGFIEYFHVWHWWMDSASALLGGMQGHHKGIWAVQFLRIHTSQGLVAVQSHPVYLCCSFSLLKNYNIWYISNCSLPQRSLKLISCTDNNSNWNWNFSVHYRQKVWTHIPCLCRGHQVR